MYLIVVLFDLILESDYLLLTIKAKYLSINSPLFFKVSEIKRVLPN